MWASLPRGGCPNCPDPGYPIRDDYPGVMSVTAGSHYRGSKARHSFAFRSNSNLLLSRPHR